MGGVLRQLHAATVHGVSDEGLPSGHRRCGKERDGLLHAPKYLQNAFEDGVVTELLLQLEVVHVVVVEEVVVTYTAINPISVAKRAQWRPIIRMILHTAQNNHTEREEI